MPTIIKNLKIYLKINKWLYYNRFNSYIQHVDLFSIFQDNVILKNFLNNVVVDISVYKF